MKVAVIGAGTAGLSVVENLAKEKEDLQIYLIEKQPAPFKNYLLIDWLSEKVTDSDFFISLEELKKKLPSLEIINDRALRVNFEKRKMFFKEKEALNFDKLVISCGLKSCKLDFPGVHKEGVHYLATSQPAKLKEDIRIFSHIIVYLETALGIELVYKLSYLKGKEIKVIAKDFNFLPQAYQEKLLNIFKEKRIDVYLSCSISEVLGELRIKALKVSTGKFLACDILILDTPWLPNTNIVKDNPNLIEKNTLKVNQFLNTSFDFCFACGEIINPNIENQRVFINNRDLALQQAKVVARNILGDKIDFYPPESKPEDRVLNNILEHNK